MPSLIAVKHNIEVAHRLYELPGKCENIHGHSMWVTLWLKGELDSHGILEGIEFGALKKSFRGLLDETYDHHLLLNSKDPLSWTVDTQTQTGIKLPGVIAVPGDPTTENIALWIGSIMQYKYPQVHAVDVWETAVNMARWKA